MRKSLGALAMVMVFISVAAGAALSPIYVKVGDASAWVALDGFTRVQGTVAYQGPVSDPADPNWKGEATYTGVRLADVLASVGDLLAGALVSVIATDGYAKVIPASALSGETAAGEVVLALDREDPSWEGAPMLVFLAPDGRFSNDDMLATLGETYSHYFGDKPSTTGLMVKNVAYVVVDYDGGALPDLSEAVIGQAMEPAPDATLTVIRGESIFTYTFDEVEGFDTVSASGTFTNSAGVDYTAAYVGVPMTTLIGNVPADATILVTASDGYSMNYKAEMFLDMSLGTWILAYKENGAYMPFDPGYFRIVQVGPDVPHFQSSLSARMVEKIEVRGEYEPYTLTATGAVTRVFQRSELEAGIGCPCHTSTVTATTKGVSATYTGLPLWRFVAYIDDEVFPAVEDGIHYNDTDFNDALLAMGYNVVLTASDGYTQTVPLSLIAHDERFIVAFKKDGAFLDSAKDGAMRFVYDDSVVLPEGVSLKTVKFLASITLVGP
ncbi:MAG: hypothetical protein PHV11_02760 [Candidatus Bipolaricaulis sp.]|nr:hypothetical protein [Candidatus Bipolaricaulis sp.]